VTRILIAEDIAANLPLPEPLRKRNAFEVTALKTGADALAMTRNAPGSYHHRYPYAGDTMTAKFSVLK
jgi:hypothetical protein